MRARTRGDAIERADLQHRNTSAVRQKQTPRASSGRRGFPRRATSPMRCRWSPAEATAVCARGPRRCCTCIHPPYCSTPRRHTWCTTPSSRRRRRGCWRCARWTPTGSRSSRRTSTSAADDPAAAVRGDVYCRLVKASSHTPSHYKVTQACIYPLIAASAALAVLLLGEGRGPVENRNHRPTPSSRLSVFTRRSSP
jgi:hypothetical protein